jgi:hypothetical protein
MPKVALTQERKKQILAAIAKCGDLKGENLCIEISPTCSSTLVCKYAFAWL